MLATSDAESRGEIASWYAGRPATVTPPALVTDVVLSRMPRIALTACSGVPGRSDAIPDGSGITPGSLSIFGGESVDPSGRGVLSACPAAAVGRRRWDAALSLLDHVHTSWPLRTMSDSPSEPSN